MIRKLNFTGRKKISRANLDINVFNENELKTFNATFYLSDLNLPDDAEIFVEPYYKSSFMRFNFGKVGNIKIPEKRYLKDIPKSENILFRVKVVDTSSDKGRLLAYADQLKPTKEEQPENTETILWVDYEKDLDQMIWKVSFELEMPTLEINQRIENARELIKSDDIFRGLVLPAVVRQILFRMQDNLSQLDEEGDLWFHKWAKFVKEYLNIDNYPEPDEEDEIEEWVDQVVKAFCRKNHLLSHYLNQII